MTPRGHRKPASALGAVYVPGKPKRIRVSIVAADGSRFSVDLTTRAARGAVSLLLEAVDKAEAHRASIPCPPPKSPRKYDKSRGLLKRSKGARPPTRAKRIESAAAQALVAIESEGSASASLALACDAIRDAITKKGFSR